MSETVGNAAAMRETLVALQARFEKNVMAYQDRYFKFTGWHWHKKAKEAARWRDVFSELNEQCRAALSVPPRNCDLYQDKKDAEVAFISEECMRPCGNCTVGDKYGSVLAHECGVEWLFAPAAERKGEGDGR